MYVLFISNSHFVRFSHSNQALTPIIILLHKDKYKPIYPSSFLAIMMNFLNVPNQIRSKKIHSFFLLFYPNFLKKSIRNYLLSRFLILFCSFFFFQKPAKTERVNYSGGAPVLMYPPRYPSPTSPSEPSYQPWDIFKIIISLIWSVMRNVCMVRIVSVSSIH